MQGYLTWDAGRKKMSRQTGSFPHLWHIFLSLTFWREIANLNWVPYEKFNWWHLGLILIMQYWNLGIIFSLFIWVWHRTVHLNQDIRSLIQKVTRYVCSFISNPSNIGWKVCNQVSFCHHWNLVWKIAVLCSDLL